MNFTINCHVLTLLILLDLTLSNTIRNTALDHGKSDV